eukprot:scaffold2446_cov106-Cylindrotheca_fusiformis.AAC.5
MARCPTQLPIEGIFPQPPSIFTIFGDLHLRVDAYIDKCRADNRVQKSVIILSTKFGILCHHPEIVDACQLCQPIAHWGYIARVLVPSSDRKTRCRSVSLRVYTLSCKIGSSSKLTNLYRVPSSGTGVVVTILMNPSWRNIQFGETASSTESRIDTFKTRQDSSSFIASLQLQKSTVGDIL